MSIPSLAQGTSKLIGFEKPAAPDLLAQNRFCRSARPIKMWRMSSTVSQELDPLISMHAIARLCAEPAAASSRGSIDLAGRPGTWKGVKSKSPHCPTPFIPIPLQRQAGVTIGTSEANAGGGLR